MKRITIGSVEGHAQRIVLEVNDQGGGHIVENTFYEKGMTTKHRGVIEGVERLVLAHACAGVEVGESRYVEAVMTVMEAAANAYT